MNINNNLNNTGVRTSVRSTKKIISNVHALVGGILFAVGLVVFSVHFLLNNNSAILALQISGGSIALSGVIELTISFFFRRSFRREQAHLDRLKAEGVSFAGEIVNIIHRMSVRYGRHFSAYAECTYINREGQTCLVKSPSFLYSNETIPGVSGNNNYAASIYVNPRNPKDYAVEIFTQPTKMQGVYDYR